MLMTFAHTGRPLAPHDLWSAWNLDPLLLTLLLVSGWCYQRGLETSPSRIVSGRRRAGFFAGLTVLAVALISPLEALAGSLASAHMVQHILLILVAAPLLATSSPVDTILRGLPFRLRKTTGGWRRRIMLTPSRIRLMRHPSVVVLLHVGALWFWHGSVPYQAALRHVPLHMLEHVTFLGTAALFWTVVFDRRPAHRTSPGLAVLLVFIMAMQGVLLAALMTFAIRPWYSSYEATSPLWGLDPLSDQHLAGLIMWVPAGLIYTLVALSLIVAWVMESEPESVERSR